MKRSASGAKAGGGYSRKEKIKRYKEALANNPASEWVEPMAIPGLIYFELHQEIWKVLPATDEEGNKSHIQISSEDLWSVFRCSVCRELMTKAHIKNDCMHRVCIECLPRFAGTKTDGDQHNAKECPICRSAIVSHRDYRLDECFETMKEDIFPPELRKEDEIELDEVLGAAKVDKVIKDGNIHWNAFLRLGSNCIGDDYANPLEVLSLKLDNLKKLFSSERTMLSSIREKVLEWISSDGFMEKFPVDCLNEVRAKVDGWSGHILRQGPSTRSRDHHASICDTPSPLQDTVLSTRNIPSPVEEIWFVLSPYDTSTQPRLERPYVRTSATCTVDDLKCYIATKFPTMSSVIGVSLFTILADQVKYYFLNLMTLG